MSEELAVTTETVHLVARSPVEMQAAQAQLLTWLRAKLSGVEAEIWELNASLNEARANKWSTAALARARNKTVGQETFYFKLLTAVEAGYTIIPDFPIDVFAIRVTRSGVQAPNATSTQMYGHPAIAAERPDIAKVGDGEYKNPVQLVRKGEYNEKRDGKEVTVKFTQASRFQDKVVFPLQAARPVVMNATAQAMALKVFDQIGICRPVRDPRHGRWAGKGDPLIIGQILGARNSYNQKCISFIIAWHLNLNEL